MLREIRVKNFAIVEDGRVELRPGLTAFTGETGAGKSLLFDAVTLLLGGKARSEMVRTGSASAEVEGLFDLSRDAPKRALAAELGFDVDDEDDRMLVVRREIAGNESGRNRIWIQGRSATRSQLQSLLGDWVEISGQHEFLRLGREDYVLDIVDQYGGLRDEARVYQTAFEAHQALAHERESVVASAGQRQSREDYLRFQVEELDRAGLGTDAGDEENRLVAMKAKWGNLEKIRRNLGAVQMHFEGGEGESGAAGVLGHLRASVRELRGLSSIDEDFAALARDVEAVEPSLAELSVRIGRLLGSLEVDPEALEQAELKLSQLARLKRKYNTDADGLAALLSTARSELSLLENFEERLRDVEARYAASRATLTASAEGLHKRREAAALALSKAWEKDLKLLGMKQARMSVEMSRMAEPTARGISSVVAQFSGNPGESPKPLGKVASGGELSRILLALKHIVAGRSEIGIYLFDEVDAGIGGETAHAVAARLQAIADENQVVVVTHLAQIAAAARDQFRIRKVTERGRTRTLLERTENDDRAFEIARMLGDPESATARKLAKELMSRNQPAAKSRGRQSSVTH